MGRNKKHKKELRSEKSKTQLKTKLTKTKFLPKGGNVTDANFKIKPIVIREQLKPNAADELVTKKKHNLKDLLTRFNHHNTTMRYEGCEGLIELLSATPIDIMEQSLHIILQGVLKLVLDIESKVRQKAIKILHLILEKVSSIKVSPFFDMLLSYSLCAMTHIDKAIQEDSLLLIDVYLECIPNLILKHFDKLFCNFLTLISKLRNDTSLSRTLTVNLNSKLTSVKWRIKVLSRLHGILNIVVENKRVTVETEMDNSKVIEASGLTYMSLYRNVRLTIENVEVDTEKSKSETDYVKVLLPLLYETWAEVAPLDEIKYQENCAMLIDHDAASILSCVVGIYYLLMDLVKYSEHQNVMRKLFLSKENKILNHFLNQFPYRQHAHGRKIDKTLNKLLVINTDSKCVQENLLICYIFCVFYKTFPSPFHLKKASELLKEINIYLTHRNYVPSTSVKTMTLVLRVIFFHNFTSWQQKQLVSEKMLDNVVNFYNNLPVDSEHRMEVFDLLIDIAKESHFMGSPKFTTWLTDLPSLLLKPEIPVKFVDTLSLLARQNNHIFLKALVDTFPEFLRNLPKLKVVNDSLPPAQIKLINMLYYIPQLNWRCVDLLQSFVEYFKDWNFVEHVQLLLLKRS